MTSLHIHGNDIAGLDIECSFINTSAKTIKTIAFTATAYDIDGNLAADLNTGKTSRLIQYVGPLALGESVTDIYWYNVFYNPIIDSIYFTSVKVTYTDDTSIVMTKQQILESGAGA